MADKLEAFKAYVLANMRPVLVGAAIGLVIGMVF